MDLNQLTQDDLTAAVIRPEGHDVIDHRREGTNDLSSSVGIPHHSLVVVIAEPEKVPCVSRPRPCLVTVVCSHNLSPILV